MFTVVEQNVKAYAGGFVTVHGGVFTSGTRIELAGKTLVPYDVADDYIVFRLPLILATIHSPSSKVRCVLPL